SDNSPNNSVSIRAKSFCHTSGIDRTEMVKLRRDWHQQNYKAGCAKLIQPLSHCCNSSIACPDARIRIRREREFHDRAETAKVAPDLRSIVRVSGFVEKELRKIATGVELSVLRTFEWRCARGLSRGIGVEWSESVHRRVMKRYPVRSEHEVVRVQI